MDITNICPNQTLVLAKQGEYGQSYSYDFSAWVEEFGEGSVGWVIQRSADPDAYPLLHEEDGNVSTIVLSETETAYSGRGNLEVFYINSGETEKRISQTFTFYIEPSLQSTSEAPPAWESYVDAVHKDAQKVANVGADASITTTSGDPSVVVTKEETDTTLDLHFEFNGLFPEIEYDPDTAIMTISYGGSN